MSTRYRASVRLTVIIPATDRPRTLEVALQALRDADAPPEEIVVVDQPENLGPSAARNCGAVEATGDVLVFVDADVAVAPDALTRIRRHFADDPGLTAVFGAYDDDPSDPGVVSAFRNLLHHHVHTGSAGRASTFWSGLGAVRRAAYASVDGFDEHYVRPSIEDIELGSRLLDHGAAIVLDPTIQGKHLKSWSFREMVVTDIFRRGAPWMELILRSRRVPTTLNLGWRHRLSALMCLLAIVLLAIGRPVLAVVAVGVFLALNVAFYSLLVRRRGPTYSLIGPLLHAVHHVCAIISVPIGIGLYLRNRPAPAIARRVERPDDGEPDVATRASAPMSAR
jgi:GT2 family glycosyltransferase